MCLGLHPLVSQQLWLWFEGGQIQPLNLTGDVEKCCRCISWMHGENFWWLNRRWRILWAWVRSWFCLCDWGFEQGICNTVNPMSFESTSWDPRNHEADFKTLLCRKKYIFFPLFSAILILQSACGNFLLSFFFSRKYLISTVKCQTGLSKLLNHSVGV